MGKDEKRGIQIHAAIDDFGHAQDYVEDLLERSSVSSQIASETLAVFESMLNLIVMQGFDSDVIIEISGERRFGDFSLKLGFEGKRFNPSDDGEDGQSPEKLIVDGFAEKVSYSYHRGYNTIRISVKTTPRAYLVSCGAGFCSPLPPI